MEHIENRPGDPEVDDADPNRLRASRRAAILGGLGKGSAALAALSPLASRASGSHKVANATNPGGFGYCSESGFQSAVISQSTGVIICSAFAPAHFVTGESLTYQTVIDLYCSSNSGCDKVGNTGSANALSAKNLANALNFKYTLSGSSKIATADAQLLLNTSPTPLSIPNAGLIILPGSSGSKTSGNALKAKNVPAGFNALAQFKAVFTTSQISTSVLEVLYEGVVSTSPARASCYYASAYLTVFSGVPASLPSSFNTTYLKNNYKSDADVAKGSNEYQFYQAVCVTA